MRWRIQNSFAAVFVDWIVISHQKPQRNHTITPTHVWRTASHSKTCPVHSAELWCIFVLARDGNYRPVDKKSITGKILLLLLPQIPFVPVCVMCVWRFFFCLSLSQIHVRCACDGATPHWSYTVVAIVTALGVCVYYARRYYSHIIITICE